MGVEAAVTGVALADDILHAAGVELAPVARLLVGSSGRAANRPIGLVRVVMALDPATGAEIRRQLAGSKSGCLPPMPS